MKAKTWIVCSVISGGYVYFIPEIGSLLESMEACRFVHYLFTQFFLFIFGFQLVSFMMSLWVTGTYKGIRTSKLFGPSELNTFNFLLWDEVKKKVDSEFQK